MLYNAANQLRPLTPERRAEVIGNALDNGHISLQAYHFQESTDQPEMTYLQRVAAGLEDPNKPQEPKTYLQRVAAGLEE